MFPLTILVDDALRGVSGGHTEDKRDILLISLRAPVKPFVVLSWIFAKNAADMMVGKESAGGTVKVTPVVERLSLF